jgi:formate-dependent nitrite reductase membrane component NrfD
VKANPWWGNVLMPIIFVLSAVVSGIALCVFNYQVLCWVRRKTVDIRCIDVMGMFLFYALVVDASIEALDIIHRTFEAEESFAWDPAAPGAAGVSPAVPASVQ